MADTGNNLQEEINNGFDRFFDTGDGDESSLVTSNQVPRVDMGKGSDRLVIYADLPGVKPGEIEVQMDKGILTIKGERSTQSASQNERFGRIERPYRRFHRRLAWPDSANPEGIEARGDNGVLEISIPKKPEAAPRRIQVGGSNGSRQGNNGNQQSPPRRAGRPQLWNPVPSLTAVVNSAATDRSRAELS